METATLVQKMIDQFMATYRDARKFDEGNKAAGTRVRAAMQDIKVGAQQVRELVSKIKNG